MMIPRVVVVFFEYLWRSNWRQSNLSKLIFLLNFEINPTFFIAILNFFFSSLHNRKTKAVRKVETQSDTKENKPHFHRQCKLCPEKIFQTCHPRSIPKEKIITRISTTLNDKLEETALKLLHTSYTTSKPQHPTNRTGHIPRSITKI